MNHGEATGEPRLQVRGGTVGKVTLPAYLSQRTPPTYGSCRRSSERDDLVVQLVSPTAFKASAAEPLPTLQSPSSEAA